MKIPVPYELNGRRRCLLVQDGETISVGRAETCSLRVEAEAVPDVELTVQFVNGCQFVVVHPTDGRVPYAQPLPWKFTLGEHEVELFRPFRPEKGAVEPAGRELRVQGLGTGESRLQWLPGQPLLLGAGPICHVVIPDAGCPDLLLVLWPAAEERVMVQVLDDAAMVGWLGRAGEGEAELDLPTSLSVNGRVLLIRSGEAAAAASPVSKPTVPAVAVVPKAAPVQARSVETGPKIVARQRADQPGQPPAPTPPPARVPVIPPQQTGISTSDDTPFLTGPQPVETKLYSPTLFLICSWLLVLLTFAVALLPQQPGMVTPEQMQLLWKTAGGTLIVTLILGLGVLLK